MHALQKASTSQSRYWDKFARTSGLRVGMKDIDIKGMKDDGRTRGKGVALKNVYVLMILCWWTVA